MYFLTNIKDKLTDFSSIKVGSFFIIFYLVGFIGMLNAGTRSLFNSLTPFAIILSLIAILLFHESKINAKLIVALSTIYLLGYFIEVIGVNTGLIFGHYQYGNGLGIKIWNTPLFIGLNWVMLTYSSSALTDFTKIKPAFKIIICSSVMVIYDILLEQIAPKLDMWYWKDNFIPLQNYIAWFITALLFHGIFRMFNITTKNKIAAVIFWIQTLFIMSLTIYFYFVK